MLGFYKSRNRIKYEKILEDMIVFNRERRKLYRSASQDFNLPDSTIYKMYSEDFLSNIVYKYNVDDLIIKRAKLSATRAKKDYDEMLVRVNKYKAEQEEIEKVRLYKKAILELKNEGKI